MDYLSETNITEKKLNIEDTFFNAAIQYETQAEINGESCRYCSFNNKQCYDIGLPACSQQYFIKTVAAIKPTAKDNSVSIGKTCNTCIYVGQKHEKCETCNDKQTIGFSYLNYQSIEVEPIVKDTNSGLNGSYYEVEILHPTKVGKKPYLAECNDITEALQMTPHEYNIFKSVWRKASARLGNGKPDNKALYDAQKCLFAAKRMVQLEEQALYDRNT